MYDALDFIFSHLPPAFLHCFFEAAEAFSVPSEFMQCFLLLAKAAEEKARASATTNTSFICTPWVGAVHATCSRSRTAVPRARQ